MREDGRSSFPALCGNRITSRIDGASVGSITKRSMPMPQPPTQVNGKETQAGADVFVQRYKVESIAWSMTRY